MISGCHIGDCHYVDGNIKTLRRTPLIKTLLSQLGVEEERFKQTWISAAEGEKFAQVVKAMVEEIKRIGPFKKQAEEESDDFDDKAYGLMIEAAVTIEGGNIDG